MSTLHSPVQQPGTSPLCQLLDQSRVLGVYPVHASSVIRSVIRMGDDPAADEDADVALAERTEEEFKEPTLYQVVLNNDDYTPMDFVVDILRDIFNMSLEQAATVMLAVHHQGKGTAGIFSKEIAETKIEMTHQRAQVAGHPLLCTMEPVGPEPGSGPRSPRMR